MKPGRHQQFPLIPKVKINSPQHRNKQEISPMTLPHDQIIKSKNKLPNSLSETLLGDL